MWNIQKIVSKGDYNYALVKNHPKSTKNGYVLNHRVIMENHLGRLLKSDEVVHHENGDKKDNRISNLKLMKVGEHERMHGYKNGRLVVEFSCPGCGRKFVKTKNLSLDKHSKRTDKLFFCSKRCSTTWQFSKHTTHELDVAISENIVQIYRDYSEQTY